MDCDNNNSDGQISHFFEGKSIFVTGGTGFMGKVLLHKLLDSCSTLDTIYVLVREKKNVLPQDRVNAHILQTPLFKDIKELQPHLLKKIKAIPGDITLPRLGISDDDIAIVIDKVSVIFHSAATVRFDEDLEKSVIMNVESTRSVLDLAHKMQKLQAFVHVSTAYSHCYNSKIEEKFYPDAKESLDELIQKCKDPSVPLVSVLGNHPNTYTFTKALAERLIQEEGKDLPIAIVRPSIVVASWKDPFPGWVDNFNGPTGIIVGAGAGIMRSMMVCRKKTADLIPVDIPINVMLVAAWKVAQGAGAKIPIYNVTSGQVNPITWGNMEKIMLKSIYKYPMETVLWYPGGSFKTSAFYDCLCRWCFHYFPALLVDVCMTLFLKPRFMLNIADKMAKNQKVLQYFSTREWIWSNHNVHKLRQELADTDPQSLSKFDFDISSIDWKEFLDNYVLGARHYVLKNSPDTLEKSRRKLKLLHLLHLLVQFVFIILISYFLMS